MLESASAHISGRKWPTGAERWMMAVAIALLVAMALGCEEEVEVDEDTAIRHAEVRAQYQAELTVVSAVEWTLLHEDSDRQRQAREQLLYLEEMDYRPAEERSEGELAEYQRRLELLWQLTGGKRSGAGP